MTIRRAGLMALIAGFVLAAAPADAGPQEMRERLQDFKQVSADLIHLYGQQKLIADRIQEILARRARAEQALVKAHGTIHLLHPESAAAAEAMLAEIAATNDRVAEAHLGALDAIGRLQNHHAAALADRQ